MACCPESGSQQIERCNELGVYWCDVEGQGTRKQAQQELQCRGSSILLGWDVLQVEKSHDLFVTNSWQ